MIDLGFLRNFDDILASLQTKKVEKETYMLAGETLVKIKLTAEKNEARGTAGLSCVAVEIDGKQIPAEKQNGKIAKIEIKGRPPTAEEQMKVVKEALGHWRIFDPPVRVSQSYVESHLKQMALKQRIIRGGKIDVHI